jgi:FKBP-type peptidyl-prolyl cis-trans isomerase
MGALLGMSLAMIVGHADAETAVTRSEHCNRLSQQLDGAIETQADAAQATKAMALQKKANRFCAERKQAQGIRTLADALKLLGVTPIDQDL